MNCVWWCVLVVSVVLLLAGCSRVQYVPVESVRTEYKVRDSIRHDSIYRLDSVFVHSKGDTVYREKHKYLYKYLFINRTDTVLRSDTIEVPVPVEKQLTRVQRAKMVLGELFAVCVVLAAFVWLIRLKMRR